MMYGSVARNGNGRVYSPVARSKEHSVQYLEVGRKR